MVLQYLKHLVSEWQQSQVSSTSNTNWQSRWVYSPSMTESETTRLVCQWQWILTSSRQHRITWEDSQPGIWLSNIISACKRSIRVTRAASQSPELMESAELEQVKWKHTHTLIWHSTHSCILGNVTQVMLISPAELIHSLSLTTLLCKEQNYFQISS